jgi:nitroreductase
MDFASLVELFKARRSIRKWKSDPVPEELLVKAVEAAGWSPNSGGKQTYRVYVVTDRAVIDAIGRAAQEVTDYLASLDVDPADRPAVERWQKSSAFFTKAPALIAVTAGVYQSIADKLQARNLADPRVAAVNANRNIAASRIQTVGCFVDHLLLALHVLGLGAVYMAGPTQAKEAVEKILGTGENEDFVALVPVGWPAEQPAAPPRKPLADFVTCIR